MKEENRPAILVMAELDWDGLHCQSHYMARRFAEDGYEVTYINRTLQRWPTLNHLRRRLSSGRAQRNEVYRRPKPPTLKVLTLWLGPPVSWLRWLNQRIIRKAFQGVARPIALITYIPTYNCVDLIDITKPASIYYLCYHNFDADVVLKDVLKSELEIIERSTKLFADSSFLQKRLQEKSKEKEVVLAPPGVHFDAFHRAYRSDEAHTRKKICFFGGAGKHLDIDLYNRLSEHYQVIFIAIVSDEIRTQLSPKIELRDTVGHERLPEILKEMDVLSILYVRSDYIDGVIPAKIFECMATGKPILVSGLCELDRFSDILYNTGNSFEKAMELLEKMPETFPDRLEKQLDTARSYDFEALYKKFKTATSLNR